VADSPRRTEALAAGAPRWGTVGQDQDQNLVGIARHASVSGRGASAASPAAGRVLRPRPRPQCQFGANSHGRYSH
jgi:hypothetical protein